jgi:hypothetical protein
MTTDNIAYSATSAVNITVASLAASTSRGSAAVYNTTTKYVDTLLHIAVQTGTSAPADLKLCGVYLYSSIDGVRFNGSSGENVSSDAAVTLDSPTNLTFAANIQCPAASSTYAVYIPIVQYLGQMPEAWGFVLNNRTGASLASTGSLSYSFYTGITYTNA